VLCGTLKKQSLFFDSYNKSDGDQCEEQDEPTTMAANAPLMKIAHICELTEKHKNAIRAIRKIKYFVARRKFQQARKPYDVKI
jgi:hypothetical protein